MAIAGPGSAPEPDGAGRVMPVQRIALLSAGAGGPGAVNVVALGRLATLAMPEVPVTSLVGEPSPAPLPPQSDPLAIAAGDVDGDAGPSWWCSPAEAT
jgi:hypothetical protein